MNSIAKTNLGLFLLFPILFSNALKAEKYTNKELILNNTELTERGNNKNPNNFIRTPDYILGPGDGLIINFKYVPELSLRAMISPEGSIYLPELNEVVVEDLTIKELKNKLIKEYSEYLKNPDIDIFISSYRPIKVFVSGEVVKPGYYIISGPQEVVEFQKWEKKNTPDSLKSSTSKFTEAYNQYSPLYNSFNFPTVFDAIRFTEGVTPYSDLSNIEVIRKNSKSNGGYIKTKINFIPMILGGNDSQNITLRDGDIIKVAKNEKNITQQMELSRKINFNPGTIIVYISGSVENSGPMEIDNGISLNQALASAGGKKIFSGDIEFIRFLSNGKVIRRTFKYNPDEASGNYKNPQLNAGDIINVKRSTVGYLSDAIGTVSTPIIGIYSLFSIYEDVSN